MKLPISWLNEYINFKKSDEEISENLTMIGNEVESIEKSLLKSNSSSNEYSNELTFDKDLQDIHEDIDEKNNDNTDFSFFEDAAV